MNLLQLQVHAINTEALPKKQSSIKRIKSSAHNLVTSWRLRLRLRSAPVLFHLACKNNEVQITLFGLAKKYISSVIDRDKENLALMCYLPHLYCVSDKSTCIINLNVNTNAESQLKVMILNITCILTTHTHTQGNLMRQLLMLHPYLLKILSYLLINPSKLLHYLICKLSTCLLYSTLPIKIL